MLILLLFLDWNYFLLKTFHKIILTKSDPEPEGFVITFQIPPTN